MATPPEDPVSDKSPPQKKLFYGQTIPPNIFISAVQGINIKHFVYSAFICNELTDCRSINRL
jgi:hypothetical protein